MGDDVFYFGSFRLVVAERVLFLHDRPVALGDRAFDLLVALLERAGQTLNSEELSQRVWPDVIVGPGTLRVHLVALRRALGDGQNDARYIVSIRGRGYCFVAPVRRSARR